MEPASRWAHQCNKRFLDILNHRKVALKKSLRGVFPSFLGQQNKAPWGLHTPSLMVSGDGRAEFKEEQAGQFCHMNQSKR